ncbi:hypothetical protein VW35_04075 [Devosia soli]|uniref:Uncharacterized protein n=1 Tax=Devosia soli TaxID=361041 RepID=A0A0F5LDW4_9HYPH|nr:hypothetical protein VW35_04075 [Devosia soli]
MIPTAAIDKRDRLPRGWLPTLALAATLANSRGGSASGRRFGAAMPMRSTPRPGTAMGAQYGRDFIWRVTQQQRRYIDALHAAIACLAKAIP